MRRTRIIVGVLVGFIAFAGWIVGAAVFADEPDPVRPTPTVVANPPVQPAQSTQDGQPDLVVREINVVPGSPIVDQDFRIDVVIANEGDADVEEGNNFFVDLFIDPPAPPEPGVDPGDPTHVWGVQYFWVPAGGEWTLSFTTQYTNTGRHDIYAVVDSTGEVVEIGGEENNIAGPESFNVRTSRSWVQNKHEDFQKGFSNLNLSHSRGLIQIGRQLGGTSYATQQFDEPEFDRELYYPDSQINPQAYSDPENPSDVITDASLQVKSQLAGGPNGEVAIVWQDHRRGGTDSDIYFANSLDGARTWSTPTRVNQDPEDSGYTQLDPAVAYSAACGGVYYVFWADNRPIDTRRSYNIWYAYSTDGQNWTEPAAAPNANPINSYNQGANVLDTPQIHPSVAVDESGNLYVAWQDRRNGNEDIYAAYSGEIDCESSPAGAVTWSNDSFVTDDSLIADASKDQVAPAIGVTGNDLSDSWVYVSWQDLSKDQGDIYVARGRLSEPPLSPLTFDEDIQMNTDTGDDLQRAPDLAAIETTTTVTYTVQLRNDDGEVNSYGCVSDWEADAVHTVWEDYRDGDSDVYYSWFFSEFSLIAGSVVAEEPEAQTECVNNADENKPDSNAFTPNANFNAVPYEMLPLSDESTSTRSCWRPGDTDAYSGFDEWQGEPSIAAPNDMSVMIAWSDGRSFDRQNYDIHMADLSRRTRTSLNYTDVRRGAMVNDNVKQLGLLADGDSYSELYSEYMPAAASQRRPSIAFAGESFVVAWDDNRSTDPFGGTITNRDIFTAFFLGEPRGTYISPVFDAGTEATWYDIQWWGVTQTDGQLLLQVRLGNTPTPPLDNVAANGWTEWSGVGGAGGNYDAPGQNIRDSDGSRFPEYRYAQYRLMINPGRPAVIPPPYETYRNGACVTEVRLNYQLEFQNVYLPIVLKNDSSGGGTTTAVPNDTYYQSYQWHMRFINAEGAWGQSKGDNVTISIIDTGIDSGHPDFSGKIVGGRDYIDEDNTPDDDDGHGTHVAGIAAAATNNDSGMAGMGWNAQIMPMKVFDDFGNASASDVSAAIRDSADQGAKVINLSLGGESDSQLLRDAVSYARSRGALLVAAAGNDFEDGNDPNYPAAIPEVLAVGSVTDERTHASYSNTGSYVDVVAPGGDPTSSTDGTIEHWIWSTYPRNQAGVPAAGYTGASGTSQASPHVAGLAALIWSENPVLNADQVMNLIMNTSTDLGPSGRDDTFGHGLVNADAAVSQASTTMTRAGADEEPLRTLASEPAPFDAAADYRSDELIVALDTGLSRQALEPTLATYEVDLKEEILDGVWLATVPKDQILTIRDTLSDQPGVRYVEPNYTYHLPDPQWRK